jgi:hypothetical protein
MATLQLNIDVAPGRADAIAAAYESIVESDPQKQDQETAYDNYRRH